MYYYKINETQFGQLTKYYYTIHAYAHDRTIEASRKLYKDPEECAWDACQSIHEISTRPAIRLFGG